MVPPKRVRLTTAGLPAADRFECFRQALLADPAPAELRCADPGSFAGKIEIFEFGTVTMADLATTAAGRRELLRGPELIRRADPHEYRLLLNMGRPAVFRHPERDTVLDAYDMTFYDTSIPAHGWSESHIDRWLSVRIAAAAFPVPAAAVKRLAGVRLHSRTGVGALLARAMIQISRDPSSYRLADARRVSATLLDLAAALVARELETESTRTLEFRHLTLMHQVQAYIQRQLGDPDLSPSAIADAHHISTRTLHRLFQDHGLAVATWIRARRLDRCRFDLADPRQAHRPVNAIAACWGFTSPEHFSRAFKSAFGVSPRAYRRGRTGALIGSPVAAE